MDRFAILWRGVVLGEPCGDLISIDSERQLKQWAPGVENDPEVTECVLWDREEKRISNTADPIEWVDQSEDFEELWSDIME